MSLTIKSIDNYLRDNMNVGQIVLDEYSRNQVFGFEQAGFLHKVKSFFGFDSAKRANERTISEIRAAIRNDSDLFAVSGEADRLLAQVKGTITTQKLSSILTTLRNRVSSSTDQEYMDMAKDSILGQLASTGAPFFLKELGKNQQFMTWYNDASAGYALGTKDQKVPSSPQEASKRCSEFNMFFDRCLGTFKGNPRQIKAFAAMCSAGKILKTTQDGDLDQKKTLENVQRLKEQFDKADSVVQEHGNLMQRVLLDNAIHHTDKLSADMMDQAIELHKNIQMEELKGLEPTASKEKIRTALKHALEECKSNIDRNVDVSTISSDLSSSSDLARMYRRVRRLAVQCAVASLPEKNLIDLVKLFQGSGAQDLWKDLKTSEDSDLKSLCNALTDALKVIGKHNPNIPRVKS